jgi:hypothetical protein
MKKIRTNKHGIPKIAVAGEIVMPSSYRDWEVDSDGNAKLKIGMGGICLNYTIGDSALGRDCDHLEPDVTIKYTGIGGDEDSYRNMALQNHSCIGNQAISLAPKSKDQFCGVVTGKHGGANHVIVYFKQEHKERMYIGQDIQIVSWGQGLKLLDYPDVHVRNIDPDALENLIDPADCSDTCIAVPVKSIIPGAAMGSGMGDIDIHSGDLDISTQDPYVRKIMEQDDLRLGDLVCIVDYDTRWGRTLRTGYVTIGVVIHGDSITSGHGPGVTAILSGPRNRIHQIDKGAAAGNIRKYLRKRVIQEGKSGRATANKHKS